MATVTEQKEEVEAALAKLHAEVNTITSGEDWTDWLNFLSRLHNYSPLNRLWMWCQWEQRRQFSALLSALTRGNISPIPAFSMPAAFSFWKDHGRMVRKGEKALTVLAPIVVTDKDKPKVNGKAATKCIGFKLKSRTFDVSQTDGDPIPENPVSCEVLEGAGDDALHAGLIRVAKLNGYDVIEEVCSFAPTANGFCSFDRKVLATTPGLPGAQRDKTLVHELAHSLLHSPEEYVRAHADARNVAEVEAESVAYVVMHTLGYDTSVYSLPYVATWSEGNGKLVANTAERVLDTAERILDALAGEGLRPAKGAARPKVPSAEVSEAA